MTHVTRVITKFEKEGEAFLDEHVLSVFDLDKLKTHFNVPDDDPLMYNCYEISKADISLFPDLKFDLDNCAYFLECYAAD